MPQSVYLSSNTSYRVENFSSDEATEPISPTSQASSGRTAPPNTPCSEYSKSPSRSHHPSVNLNLVHTIDLRAINYDGSVEENLICAICRCPLIDPISTTTCQHTFCLECLNDALLHSSTCPIDRTVLKREFDLVSTPRIIQNQLDNLKVLCPCCKASVSRSMIGNHMSKYCPESLMRCPGRNTEKRCPLKIPRKLSSQGCLHYLTTCPDCEESLLQIDLPSHRENSCKERYSVCEECGTEILCFQRNNHEKECPEKIVFCKWKDYGCRLEFRRKELDHHLENCSFHIVGNMADILRKEIDELRSKVCSLTETNQLQERRIKFLESSSRQFERDMEYSDMPSRGFSPTPEAANVEPLNSGQEYLLSLLEFQESKLSQLSAGMTEMEAKQTTMLFNETIPIKNEIAEIRSLQQTASMHIRWLMAFRIRENSRRIGSGNSSNGDGPDGAGSSGDSSLMRRPSDTLSRDIITKL